MSKEPNNAIRYLDRPGFQQVFIRDVALPVYRLGLSVKVRRALPLPVFSEFILRVVDAGISDPDDVSRFLGIPMELLADEFVSMHESNLIVILSSVAGADEIVIAEHGRAVLETGQLERYVIQEYEVDIDGITREIYTEPPVLIRGRDVDNQGLLRVPPIPNRAPTLGEIDVGQLNRIVRDRLNSRRNSELAEDGAAGEVQIELLQIVGITGAAVNFMGGQLICYRGLEGTPAQVAVAVEGVISARHEAAFTSSRMCAEITEHVSASSPLEVEQAITDLESALGEGVLGTLALPESYDQVGVALVDARVSGVSIIETSAHPVLLKRALTESQSRLIIFSPWLSRFVVDKEFLASLEDCLVRGCNVFIAYGLGLEDRDDPAQQLVAQQLSRLASEHEHFQFRRLGDLHAKILVSDTTFAVVGSFNWLSFKGDPSRTFRDERGILVQDCAEVEQVGDAVLERFEVA